MIKFFDYSIAMAEDIITIDKETFHDITMSSEDLCNRFKDWENYKIYLAYINNEPAGFIGIMRAVTPHYEGWWIDLLAVMPGKQKKGIGSKLVAFVKENYKKEGSVITALIRKNNVASIKASQRNGLKTDENVDFGLFILE